MVINSTNNNKTKESLNSDTDGHQFHQYQQNKRKFKQWYWWSSIPPITTKQKKFKQWYWWSSIPPISTKQTITSHLNWTVLIVQLFFSEQFSYPITLQGLGLWCLKPFQQYFSYIMAVSIICGGNWCTRRKPLTCHNIALQETIIQPQNYTIITPIFRQWSTVSKGHYALPNNTVEYPSWLVIVSYMIALGPTTSEEMRPQRIHILKMAWKC